MESKVYRWQTCGSLNVANVYETNRKANCKQPEAVLRKTQFGSPRKKKSINSHKEIRV